MKWSLIPKDEAHLLMSSPKHVEVASRGRNKPVLLLKGTTLAYFMPGTSER